MGEQFDYEALPGRVVFGSARRVLVGEADRLGVKRILLIATGTEDRGLPIMAVPTTEAALVKAAWTGTPDSATSVTNEGQENP